jgi:hypothetical protein
MGRASITSGAGKGNGVKSLFLTLACRFDTNPFNGKAPPNPI